MHTKQKKFSLNRATLKKIIQEELRGALEDSRRIYLQESQRNCGCYQNFPAQLIDCFHGRLEPCREYDGRTAIKVKPAGPGVKDVATSKYKATEFIEQYAGGSKDIAIELIMKA